MVVNFIACLPGAAIIFLGVAFGIEGLQAGLAACPAWVMTGLAAAGTMMTAVGFGILLSMIWSTDIAVFFFVGFICAKSLGLSSLGIAVIGAAIALTLFFIDKRIIDAKNAVAAAPAAGAATLPTVRRISSDGKRKLSAQRKIRSSKRCSGTAIWSLRTST